MSRQVIYGASDDLLELEGDVSDEIYIDQDEPWFIGCSDGTLLRLTCDDEGAWRFSVQRRGLAFVEVTQARGEDAGRDEDGCPGYSDKVVIKGIGDGGIRWVLASQRKAS